jgi:hypothetical protein
MVFFSQNGFVRNDFGRLTTVQFAKRERGRMGRINLARNQVRGIHHDACSHLNRVCALVGVGVMTADTGHGDFKIVARRHAGARSNRDFPAVNLGPQMDGEGALDRKKLSGP